MGPFKRLEEGLHQFVSAAVERIPRWTEAMAACEVTANTTVWCLCEVLNGCGPSALTDSDKGNHLADAPIQRFLEGVGVHQLTRISYHPQSSRVVKRASSFIKVRQKLIAEERGLCWDEALLFACWEMGTKELARYRCSPQQASSMAMPANSRAPPIPIRSWGRVPSAGSTGPCCSPESQSSGAAC